MSWENFLSHPWFSFLKKLKSPVLDKEERYNKGLLALNDSSNSKFLSRTAFQ